MKKKKTKLTLERHTIRKNEDEDCLSEEMKEVARVRDILEEALYINDVETKYAMSALTSVIMTGFKRTGLSPEEVKEYFDILLKAYKETSEEK